MKQFLFLSVLALLSACSKPMSPASKVDAGPQPGDVVREYEARVVSNQNPQIVEGVIDYGTLNNDKDTLITLALRNSSTEGEAINGPVSLATGSNFAILSTGECFPLSVKNKCFIRLVFKSKNLEPGLYEDTLHLGNEPDRLSLGLKVSVQEKPLPAFVSNLVVSDETLNFDTLTQGSEQIRVLKISNRSNLSVNYSASVPADFSIISDSCSNKILAVKTSCYIRIALSGAGKQGAISGQLSFGPTVNVFLNGNVETAQETAQRLSDVVLNFENAEYTTASALNLGSMDLGKVYRKDFVLKNKGNAPVQVVSTTFASAQVSVVANSCFMLGPKSECRIKTLITPSIQEALNLSVGLSFETRIFPVQFNLNNPSPVACNLGNAASNGIDVSGVTSVTGNQPDCYVATCNETTHTLYNLGVTSKRCATLEKVYQIQALSPSNQVRENEYIWANSPFGIAWLYRNQSFANVDGVRAYDIEMDVPYAADFSSSVVFPFSGTNFGGTIGVVQSCSLKAGGKIEPNGYCTVISAANNVPHPTGFSVVSSYTGGFNVISPQTNEAFANTFLYRKLLPTTVPRTAIAGVMRMGAGGDPGINEGADNTPRGMTLARMNLENSEVEYIGPCRTKTDGTAGDPRGVYPWISEGYARPIKTIGNKVYFTGRGCSSTGLSISFEKWGMWEYDSTQVQSATNPRRISRTLSQSGNWPMDEAPREDMLVLNNKLYFSATSLIGAETNGSGDFRRALFEYNPSLPLQQDQSLANPNPKEILTGYERELAVNNPGASSYPASITVHNGKIYFLGVFYREHSQGAGFSEYHNGVLSYDPSLPLDYGNIAVLESTDNPRFEWGYTESQYALWQFDSWPATTLFVDDNYFIFGAKMPRDANPVNNEFDTNSYPGGFANYDAFLAQLRDDRGQEVTFVHRSTGNIHKPDLCPGICDGRPNYVKKVGNYYLFLSFIDGVEDNKQVFAATPTGSPDGSISLQSFNPNLAGQDVRSDKWNFVIHVIGNKAYLPLIPEAGKSSMYEFDASTNTLTRLLFGNFEGKTQNAFAIPELMQNGDLVFRGQFLDGTAVIYSTAQPLAGTASNVINSNPYQKSSGSWWNGFQEDEHFYYFLRNGLCPGGGDVPFYVDYVTKTRDSLQSLYNHPRYDAGRCSGEYRYRAEAFILLRNN